LSAFSAAIREYAAALGKQDFMLLGEMYGSDDYLGAQYGRIERTLRGNLSAIFDNGSLP